MEKIIENFAEQFAFTPEIKNEAAFMPKSKFIVAGMGGSHLAGDLVKTWDPNTDALIHHDYGLPALKDENLRERLFIASSYSGNTEETLDSLNSALEKKLSVIAISVGGKLIEIAKKKFLPYIKLPEMNLQPRNALGYSFKALLCAMRLKKALREAGELVKLLKPREYEVLGRNLAYDLAGKIPIIYSSGRNFPLAYIWKIKLNETAKVPAFCNTFPELNHNEMIGFDAISETKMFSGKFHFIFLTDEADHPKIKKRMDILKKLYIERDLPVFVIPLSGKQTLLKMFSAISFADWISYYLAMYYGVNPEKIPMIDKFKKLISE